MRTLTGGESHGPAVVTIIDDVPAGLSITAEQINRDLARRQTGYGRGGRMAIEKDRVEILSGVRDGATLGSPVTLLIENRDHEKWLEAMSAELFSPGGRNAETRPRPGHGDLAGMLKYGTSDARDILERASARETAARVAAGAVARRLLAEIGVRVLSRVVQVGTARASTAGIEESDFERADSDAMRCADAAESSAMVEEVDRAVAGGYSLGGIFEVVAFGLVPGIGSHAQSDRRLDGRLFAALASVPAIKGVEIGEGFALAGVPGNTAHDEIFFKESKGLYRETNRAGGLEAGMTNGEPLVLRAAMKPIPTQGKPLATVDVEILEAAEAFKERADVCAVPAASIVGEAVVAFVLADAVQEKFGGDSIVEIKRNLEGYLEQIGRLWRRH
ncbi:MAG: chorismate synthase [Candidatus Geothermincolia bacterium]